MEIANLKPRLGSEFVREAFLRHFLSRKVDDEEESRKKRLLRAVIFFKEFTAFIGACLNGTLLRLEYCYAKNCWKCRFEEPIDEWLTEKESLIILAFAKPKLRAVFMTSDEKAPPMNEQLTNYLAGIPRLFIPLGEANIYSLALLKKMAPHLSSLTCSPEYLNHNLPRMKLEMCKVQCFGISKINLGPLFSKHQIRQIVLDFYNNLNDDRIVCGGRSLNPSVEELHVLTAKNSPVSLPKRLLKRLPNLKRVLLSWDTWNWDADYVDKLRASIECARYCVGKSPNLRAVFDVCVYDYDYSDADVYLRKLREHGLLGDEEHSFVTKKELENDPDIKLCQGFDCEDGTQFLVRSTGQIKCFFWYNC